MAVGGGGGEGAGVRDAFYGGEAGGDDLVGAVLDPLGGGGVGWAAVGWVVLEAAVLGWVVRGGDDDAVGEVDLAAAVVGEDGVGERGGGGVGEVVVDDGVDVVGGEDFEGGGEGGLGEGVGVLGEEEGAGDVLGRGGSRQMAWVMAAMWSSLKAVSKALPRWPEVPKATRWAGTAGSGWRV